MRSDYRRRRSRCSTALREELHLYAKNRGAMVGPITLVDSGDEIDCSRMGSRRLQHSVDRRAGDRCSSRRATPSSSCTSKKTRSGGASTKTSSGSKHNCILTHGGGQPPRGVRRMLHRLHHELKLPIYCLLDNDPWGYYIYSVIKQGSINLAYESQPHGDSRRPVSRPAQQRLRALRALRTACRSS